LTPERWAQIRQIFDGALERQQQERAAYLRGVCGGDDQLRREVESLVASHEESQDFMSTPAADLNMLALDVSSASVPRVPRVGPYQLEKRIGRGGMGSVWLASRADQEYHKKVAVKMVKRGMDSAEILRRFRMERQVLARLDHPNIARLIDGGSTAEGSPYLVMEYVEGTPIDQYCESHQSTISERLNLFRNVCAAVQYAHSNLVVHRDIKAGNILVTKDGTPKLLDFGIAKLMDTDFSPSAAAETRPELRPMTLEYASPEQVRGEPITTASDVYSLGVLLYRLLTGRFPFEGADTRSRMAMQQAICEKEPPRPSSVVLSDGDSSIPQPTRTIEIAREETRDKARRRLKRKLAGDLDVIILKALRKDPARRYVSAEQFSEDIRRYLEGKPVKARGDTLGYRALRFVQRNPVGVAGAAVVLALLLASVAWLAVTMRRVQAQIEAARGRELALEPALIRAYDRLGDLYKTSDPSHASGEFRQAVETSREFLRAHPERTDLRRDLAWAEIKLGDLEPREAEALYTDALGQFAVFAKADASDLARQKDVMEAERKLGLIQYSTGNLVAALTSFSRALQIAEALAASPEQRRAAAACNFEKGEVLAANHEPEAAVANLRKALELYRDLAGSADRGVIREGTPAAFEMALEQVAENAPKDLQEEITTELGRMRSRG
jgi:eukaryotic-like serine/threonine-protein kinase